MFRILVTTVLLAGILGVFHVQPAAAHSGIWQVQAGNGLNLRTGPGGTYHRLYTMPNGRLVTAKGHRGNWMYLRDRVTGTVGWASLTYLVAYSGGGGST